MRQAVLLLLAVSVSGLGVGCCHRHSRGCYDSSTGLVKKRGMFDTCQTGTCDSGCNDCQDPERWYDFSGRRDRSRDQCDSCKQKQRKSKGSNCDCQDDHGYDDGCDCQRGSGRQKSRAPKRGGCQCQHGYGHPDYYGQYGDGTLIPYDGTYVDGNMVYDGQVIYGDGYHGDCPTCNSQHPTPTYESQGYPELMTPQEEYRKPMPAPAAEPLPTHETSTIPPASYVVPQPFQVPTHSGRVTRIQHVPAF